MISDKTIDEKNAKYWCIFANEDFKKALDEVSSEISRKKSQNVGAYITRNAIKSEQLNEGFSDFLAKISPTDPTGGSVGIVSDLSGKSKEEIKANAVAMASAAAIAATALTPIGRAGALAVGKTAAKHPLETGLVVAAGKIAMDASGDKDDNWWDKLTKLGKNIFKLGEFAEKHAKELAIAGTVAYSLFQTAPLWMPMLSLIVKSILRGKSLAIVEFDSNGTMYRMHYDIKYKRWELIGKGAFTKDPSPEEVEQLMKTRFFKKFISQCKRYIDSILKNDDCDAILNAIKSLVDKKTSKIIDEILLDEDVINNMFALKFKY